MATKHPGSRTFFAGFLLVLPLGLTFPEWGVAGERLDKIRLVHSNRGGSQAIAAVVQEAGIFRKYGLDLEMIFIAGTLSIKSLLAGEVQMALAAGPAAALARLAGGDIVVIMGLLNTTDHVLFSDKRIARIQDLRGKKLGVSTFGALDDVSARYVLKKFGLQPDQDVTILQLGGQPVRIAALQSGSVHATLLQPPLTVRARKMGFNELTAMVDLGLNYQGASVDPPSQLT